MSNIDSGIYLLEFANGNNYVGSSNNIKRRLRQHIAALQKNQHCNKRMQRVFNKYGKCSMIILEACETTQLIERERWWISLFKPLKWNLNISDAFHTPFHSERNTKEFETKRVLGLQSSEKFKEANRQKASLGGKARTGKKHPLSKAVVKFDENGNIVAKYESMNEAAKANNVSRSSVEYCCHGIRNFDLNLKFETDVKI